MPSYMTQKMSSGVMPAVTYYRKQSQPHVPHTESDAFTEAAVNAYAALNAVSAGDVEKGTYKSGQGVPTGGNTQLI